MPEVRNSGRTALADPSGGGFFIRRMASPGAVVVKGGAVKPLARRVLPPSSKKENVPPSWAVTVRTTPKMRRRPLPEWYPRSPLHDITSVVKAVERRSRLGNAVSRQQLQLREDSSRSVDPATPVQTEQGVPQSTPTPTQKTLDVAAYSCPGSTQAVASTSTTHLAESKLKASSSPSDCSLQTPSRPNDPALADLMEKKLSSSIEQIEKMVSQNLTKRAPKAAQPSKRTIQRRTLMSMR